MTTAAPRTWGPPPLTWLTERAPAWSFGVYLVICLMDSYRNTGGMFAVYVGAAAGVAYYPLVKWHLSERNHPGGPLMLAATLTGQAVLTYLPLLAGSRWIGFGGLLAAAFLIMLRAPWGPLLAAGVVVLNAVLIGFIPGEQYLGMGDVLSLMLGFFLLSHLPRAIMELQDSQGTAEELAAARERLRMSRDLHDLLGRGLVTVAVKSELAAELLRRGDPRAAAELTSIAEVTEQARAELGSLAGEAPLLDLSAEITSAVALLRGAGITVDVTIDEHHGQLPPGIADVLAWAVREGVTNVLQHSKARTCTLTLGIRGRECLLTLVNDGVARPADTGAESDPGIGLAGQAERVSTRGGRISAGRRPGGRYALVVEVPVRW